MRTYIILSFALVLLLAMSGCKGYEDGPVVSMRTVKGRIYGWWEPVGFWINGEDMLADFDSIHANPYGYDRSSNYSFLKYYDINDFNFYYGTNIGGFWGLNEDKSILAIKIITGGNMAHMNYTITKLTHDDLQLKGVDFAGDTVILHLTNLSHDRI